jgi:DNA-binding transcriptional ArsR family regulator
MSIADALFSDAQARLFRWLFGQPGRSFHLSELRRLTGLGSASLQRELRKLTDAGLVMSERVGNLRRFQANPKSPVLGELVALTRKTVGLEPMLREALLPLTQRLRAAWIPAYPVACQFGESKLICRNGPSWLSDNASRVSAGFPQ